MPGVLVMQHPSLNTRAGIVFLLLNLMLSSACQLLKGTMSVQVLLPEFPAVWAGADWWELSCQSQKGLQGPFLVLPGSSFPLQLPRGEEAAILCRAVFGIVRTLPYGVAWPQDLSDDGFLRPDAIGGYAASLAAIFYRAGFSECGFDLNRFAVEAETRMDDPWDLDPVFLATLIARHGFRIDYLKTPDHVSAVLAGIPLALAPDSPWVSAAVPDENGLATVSLSPVRVGRWLHADYEVSAAWPESGELSWTLCSMGLPDQRGTLMENTLPAPSRLDTDASPP